MNDKRLRSFRFPVPPISVNALFVEEEFDFYKKSCERKLEELKHVERLFERSEKIGNAELREDVSKEKEEHEKEGDALFLKLLREDFMDRNHCNELEEGTEEEAVDLTKESGYIMKNEKQKINHPFENTESVTIREEWRQEWMHHLTPAKYETIQVSISDFQKECEKIRDRLNKDFIKTEEVAFKYQANPLKYKETPTGIFELLQKGKKKKKKRDIFGNPLLISEPNMKERIKQEEIEEENKQKNKMYAALIKILTSSNIRVPSILEIVCYIVNYNSRNWQQKINPNIIRTILDPTRSSKFTNKGINCSNWIPSHEKNPFNLYQIITKLKEKTISTTFQLICDFNNTRLKTSQHNLNIIDTRYLEHRYVQYTNHLRNLSSKDLFIISVTFYHPIRGIKISQYEILSNQTLAHLTDVFFCFDSSNYGIPQYHGSMYYINGVLYPDLRKKDATDYAEGILEFFRDRYLLDGMKPSYGVQQHKAILKDIKIPLFQRCCFLHQGNCEHRIIFTNIRQYNTLRDKPESEYPLRVFRPNILTKVCVCCRRNTAKKIVYDSYLLTVNPSYLCNECFSIFLIGTDGTPVDKSMIFFDYIDNI